jgi:hypothetical protein
MIAGATGLVPGGLPDLALEVRHAELVSFMPVHRRRSGCA